MVRKFFNRILHKKISELHVASYTLTFMFLVSLLFTLLREHFLAGTFGAGETLDLYFAAFRVPDIIFALVGSFISVYAFLPFFEEKSQESEKSLKSFVDSTFSFFFTILVVVSIIAFIFMPFIIGIFFSGFDLILQTELVTLSRILLLQPIFLGISNFFSGIVQYKHRFVIYGLSPILYNFGIMVGIVALTPSLGIVGVVYGVLIGAFLHAFIMFPFLFSDKSLPTYKPRFMPNTDVKKLIRSALPRVVGVSFNTITIFILIGIASTLSSGSISVFAFSQNLTFAPLTLIGVSYSVASFPLLTRLFCRGQIKEFKNKIKVALRHIILWAIPAVIVFIILRAHIVRIVLGSGAFDWQDTRLTAASLAIFSIVILIQSVSFLLIRACYASKNTLIPVVSSIIASFIAIFGSIILLNQHNDNIEFSTFFDTLLRVEGLPGTEVLTLVAAFTLASIIQAIILVIYFHIKYLLISRGIMISLIKALVSSASLGVVSFSFLRLTDDIFDINTFIGVFLHGFLSFVIGILVWFLVLKLLKSRELSEVIAVIKPNILWVYKIRSIFFLKRRH